MTKSRLPLARVYRLLEPGPVVLVSTAGPGRPNAMTLSWHTMLEFEPPLVGFVMSGRHLSFELLDASGECVINLPTAELLEAVIGCGNVSGRRVDKFRRFGLTAVPSARVGPPAIGECLANLECRVVDRTLVAKYNFFVVEVVAAWIDRAVRSPRTLHHAGQGVFVVDGEVRKTRSRAK